MIFVRFRVLVRWVVWAFLIGVLAAVSVAGASRETPPCRAENPPLFQFENVAAR